MSRIDDMIAEYCPDGVEFKAICTLVLKTENIRWSEHGNSDFHYIDLTSVDRNTHAIVETSIINSKTAPSRAQQLLRTGDVIFGTTRPMLKRYTVIPQHYDRQICSTGFCVLRPNHSLVLTNFLFHMLGTSEFYKYIEANERGASYPAISDSLIKKFFIPIPPLSIQQEIVKVLDAFTELEAELEAELGAELEARRKQYNYYRNKLLSFNDKLTHEGGGSLEDNG